MPKQRVTLTLDKDLITEIDAFVDGELIRSRSEAIDKFLKEFLSSKKTAVILAGGDPKNLLISESDIYRPLAIINREPLIKNSIEKIIAAGFQNILIIGSDVIVKKINKILGKGKDLGAKIEYFEEPEPLGTAKTLQKIQHKIKSDFLVVPADTFFDFNLSLLQDFHFKQQSIATFAIYTRTTFDSKYKGVVEMQGSLITSHIEQPEKPTTHLIKTLIAMFSPDIFEYIPAGKIKYTIETDVIQALINERRALGYLVSGDWFNIHTQDDLQQVENYLRNRRK
jgi:NDP-sugar pyrophosphorylase family protein